jgi:PAS domain S-box-containing protein
MRWNDIRKFVRALAQPVTYLGVAMLVSIYCTLTYLLIADSKVAEYDAERRGGNLVRVVDQSFSHIFKSVDASLLFLRKIYQQNPATFDLAAWARDPSVRNELTFYFGIADAKGRVVDTSFSKRTVGDDRSGHEVFRVHADSTADALFISRPLITNSSGKQAIMLSRRIDASDGTFAGVIVAYLDPSELVKHIGTIDLGPDGSVALVGLDSYLRTRAVNGTVDWENIGRKVSLIPETLGRAFQASSGHYWSVPGVFNNVLRLVSYRVLETFPLIALVTISEVEVYRRANENARIYWGISLLLTVAIAIAIGFGAMREQKLIESTSKVKQAQALTEESRGNLARAETMALLGHYRIEIESDTYIWSDGVYRITGKSPQSFTPTLRTVLELIHPDDRSALEQYRRDVRAGLDLPPITLRVVRDDGQIIHVEGWTKPLRASDGTVTWMFGTMQDVTARKQAEEALARANQELETRVAERTAELAQEMHRREQAQMTLAQMQKLEAVGQLTAGIAHDFNNLLAVIGGGLEFIETAAARGLTAEPELIDAATRATRRGSELVQRLLAFSRQSPLKNEPTMLDQLVLDTLRLLQRTLGAEIDIVTQLNATMAAVSVDRSQLANTLVNLALNARDAMPEGGEITIATTCQASPWAAVEGASRWPTGEEVCITISDTGVGMTEEVHDRAFEPFFTTKKDGLGSGLGLSMVHGFVEQSGGHIEIESEVERGTTITIHLPKVEMVSQAVEADAPAGKSVGGREKVVLLVEDDPDVRIMTAAQLKQLGYSVHAVANGNDAIDLIESPATIDITLTDIVLPGGVDGVTLVKEAMRMRPRMGVLCMSGYDPTRKHRKWFKVQNIELLEKPFSSARLAQALKDVLAH